MSCSKACLLFAAAVVVLHQLCFFTATTTTVVAASGILLSNDTDRMALLEFKSMIVSDPLGALTSWNDSTHFCQWYGVSCTERHDRVTIIDLRSQKLTGSISPHIGNLSFLKKLILYNNSFSKGIPPEIGRLRRLQRLSLFNNSLDGEIPSNISGCSALTLFHVMNNKLTGQLPWQMGSLKKLQIFYGDYNDLTGRIPPSFSNLSSLQIFVAATNRLSGEVPDALCQLKNLQVLVLQFNMLSGEIPDCICNLSSLTTLYFGYNQLHGILPRNLGISLLNLVELDAGSNHFTGRVPSSLSNASNLVLLQLQDNNFTGSMPSMGSSHNLVHLTIDSNSLGSGNADDLSFLSSLTNGSSLQVLIIHRNNFGGSLTNLIGNFPTSLEELSLSANKFSGSIPSGIQNLVNLQRFSASENDLSGTIPSNIGIMKTLQWLNLESNNISGSIPSSIGALTELLILTLSNNSLQGEIPAVIGNCQKLIGLDLSYNNLNGVIPPQVMSLSSLSKFMDLSYNNFSSALPIEVGRLKNLGFLDLSHNMLSGEIPNSVGSCMVMETLKLQGNLFHGTIPSSLSSLRGIQRLDVSSNNLSGQIPEFLGSMKMLQLLNLSYNNFEGQVPVSGVFKNASIISTVGNSKLCGGVVELNLPPCNFKHLKKQTSSLSLRMKILISVISSLLFLTCMCSCLLILWIKKRGKQDAISANDSQLQLSYHNLYKATDGFSISNLIGVGSFGSVYRGVLDMNRIGTTIAVKVFKLQRHGAIKSFMAECTALRNIRHINLVRILTVCSGVDYQGNDFKALIYELLANGSLEDWLHPVESGDEPRRRLNFLQRLNIAIDVAYAVDYLHHQCGTPMVHCDLKPSNVLLDEDMRGHVSDFGLARLLTSIASPSPTTQTSSSIGIKGTVGYAPPEYGMGNENSIQGDVYSYGVLLLELFTGKRPTDETFNEGWNIHGFVRSALSDKSIAEVVDPIFLNEFLLDQTTTHCNNIRSSNSSEETINMKGQILKEVLISILEIGVVCSSDVPHERISISDVATRLVTVRKLLISEAI
ncbi:unnamed protein product [Linum trigynum]|uniref:non-specific serine/threonine protein kinase n=2 Tax=Linum trigynum TaxID=586398 RepID=A0AAV2D3U5_9ROSI